MNRDNDFQCDRESKNRVMEAMKEKYKPNIFTYEIDPDPYSKIDCRAIGITNNGKTIHYAIECKQRNCTASTYDSYYCEPSKYDELNFETIHNGVDRAYIANEFSDGSIYLWNINDIDRFDIVKVKIARTTVGIGDYLSQKIEQERLLMPREKGIRIK